MVNIKKLSKLQPFDVHFPKKQICPCVFSSPHSGTNYTPEFLSSSQLDPSVLRRSEDSFVNHLFSASPNFGSPLISANFPRAYLDVNREPYELDPEMFSDSLPGFVNTSSGKVALGLGTIAKTVASGAPIYKRSLSWAEAEHRIETLYFPYHAALKQLLVTTRARFGAALLIDCHSMPSRDESTQKSQILPRADIVLGDKFGRSCSPTVTELVEDTMKELGYSVVRNDPYAGGFATQNYGRPKEGFHALQIELNRALYMDERLMRANSNYNQVFQDLKILIKRLSKFQACYLLENKNKMGFAAE